MPLARLLSGNNLAQLLFLKILVRVSNRSLPLLLNVAGLLHASFAGLLYASNVSAEEPAPRPNVRDVTPPGIMRVYGAPGEADTAAAERRRFDNVRVLADGKIRSGAITISLYGVVLPARDKLCVTPAGARWACGVSAIGALRNMVQSRAIDCTVYGHDFKGDEKDRFVGSCRIGQTDIALRLLELGWATLDQSVKERRYLEAAEYGREKGLGLGTTAVPTVR